MPGRPGTTLDGSDAVVEDGGNGAPNSVVWDVSLGSGRLVGSALITEVVKVLSCDWIGT